MAKLENSVVVECIKEILNGNKDKFELLEPECKRIFNITCNIKHYLFKFPYSKEDLYQDTLINVIKYLKSYNDQKGEFITWYTWIIRNSYNDQCRATKKRDPLKPDFSDDSHTYLLNTISEDKSAEDTYLDNQACSKIIDSINAMPPNYKEPLLNTVRGLSNEEGAEQLGLAYATYTTRLSRARGQLEYELCNC